MKILVLTDNKLLLEGFLKIIKKKQLDNAHLFTYGYSPKNRTFEKLSNSQKILKKIDVKKSASYIIKNFSLVISLHSQQIFPSELVKNIRCVNIHPGYNPYNRGWYPHVFSIINGLPAGATIHEMDEQIDHGPIICQKEVQIDEWDTAGTLYNKIVEAEFHLIEEYIEKIIEGKYVTFEPSEEGNINYKNDFERLCELDMNSIDTFENHIRILRALSHDAFFNAYYIKNNKKIRLRIQVEKEKSDER